MTDGASVARPARSVGARTGARWAVERNEAIVPRSTYAETMVEAGGPVRDRAFHWRRLAWDGFAATDDTWTVAGRQFRSRLVVGTGKYKDLEETAAAIEASGAEIVTVAVRRGEPVRSGRPRCCRITSTPSATPTCRTPPAATLPTEAVRTLRLAREGWRLELGQARSARPAAAPLSRHGSDLRGPRTR